MEGKFFINEAIAEAKAKGIEVTYEQLAQSLWPDTSAKAQYYGIRRLLTGATKKIDPLWVENICKICDCTPNFLFGYEE